MIEQQTASRLRTIRSAGLGRVKAQALRQGITSADADMQTLKWIANGSITQAADKLGVNSAVVGRTLRKYEKIAKGILEEDARRGRR